MPSMGLGKDRVPCLASCRVVSMWGPSECVSECGRVSGFGFRVSGFGFRASGSGFRVSGFGFRVSGFGLRGETRPWMAKSAAETGVESPACFPPCLKSRPDRWF